MQGQYTPSLHTASNKPYGLGGNGGPTDARSYFFDEATVTYRPYANVGEVATYLNQNRYREGRFSIIVDDGTGAKEYWYKDGQNGALVLKGSPVVVATDLEVQVKTAPATEDSKVVSRLKLYNWWDWIRTKVDPAMNVLRTMTQEFGFALIKLSAPPGAGTLKGHFWFDGTDVRFFKTAAEYVITSDTNTPLKSAPGSAPRVMVADDAGGVDGLYDTAEEIVTDPVIIAACTAATFTGHIATISVAGKPLYKGQRCIDATHLYLTIADNTIIKILLQ